ncbi:hypothetical protein ACFJGW_04345 [Burkholderiaceae bacterium UC74_6]
MNKAFLWVALGALPLLGHAAAIDKYSKRSYINGQIRPGDFEKAEKEFAQGTSPTLIVKVASDSVPFETMRIGLLLREHKPALSIERDCVGPCASFILTSGSKVHVDQGRLIALNVRPEWEAWAFDRIRDGGEELFIDQEMSQLSRARLLDRFKIKAKSSGLMRDAADQLMRAPAAKFLRDLTLPVGLDRVAFDEERYDFNLSLKTGQCLWWVPDAQGLAQLGIQVTDDYRPVDRVRAAKQLEVSPALVYVGPMVEPMPEGGLCTKP